MLSGEMFASVHCQVGGEHGTVRNIGGEDILNGKVAPPSQELTTRAVNSNGLTSEPNKDKPILTNGMCKKNPIRTFFPSSDRSVIKKQLEDSASTVRSVEKAISHESKVLIDSILQQIKKLSGVEKLLLFLQLPTGQEVPLKQPVNVLGSRPEIGQTIMWIKTHLCEDKDTSLPKQDVYNEYMEYCNQNGLKALSTADFGKVMKQVYVNVRPRRLGTRGNSRYCYAGMAKREVLPTPVLPTVPPPQKEVKEEISAEERLICEWASGVLGLGINTLSDLTKQLVKQEQQAPAPPPSASHVTDLNGQEYASSCRVAKPSHPNKIKSLPSESKRKSQEDCLMNGKLLEGSCSRSKKGRKGQQGKKSPPLLQEDKAQTNHAVVDGKVAIPRIADRGGRLSSTWSPPETQDSSQNGVFVVDKKITVPLAGRLSSSWSPPSALDSDPSSSSIVDQKMTMPRIVALSNTWSPVIATPENKLNPPPVTERKVTAIPQLEDRTNRLSSAWSVDAVVLPRPQEVPPSSSAPPTPSPAAHHQHPAQTKIDPDSNSLDMDEELLKYFQCHGDDEPKLSQLRLLLERRPVTMSGGSGRCGRRVSFDTAAATDPPPASFVPIAPAAPPSVPSADEAARSHSVPMVPPARPPSPHSSSVQFPLGVPEQTPVPSELADFDDSLHQLLLDALRDCHSYPGTPSYGPDPVVSAFPRCAKSYPCTPSEPRPIEPLPRSLPPPLIDTDLSLLPEDLNIECDDTFNNLAREISHDYIAPD